jgi:hypothetical protein
MTWVTLGVAGASQQIVGPEDAPEFRVCNYSLHVQEHNSVLFVLNCALSLYIGCRLDCSGRGGVLFDNISHGS